MYVPMGGHAFLCQRSGTNTERARILTSRQHRLWVPVGWHGMRVVSVRTWGTCGDGRCVPAGSAFWSPPWPMTHNRTSTSRMYTPHQA